MNCMLNAAAQYKIAVEELRQAVVAHRGGIFKIDGSLLGVMATATAFERIEIVLVDTRGVPVKVDVREFHTLLLHAYEEATEKFLDSYQHLDCVQ